MGATGLPSLDWCLGDIRGLVEVFGPESCGKTTLAYHLLRRGGLLITTETDYDPTLAPDVVHEEGLHVLRPAFGEAAIEAAGEFLPGVVAIDSASALLPAISLATPLWEERQKGGQARMLAFGARKLSGLCERVGGMVVCTQQLRKRLRGPGGPHRIPYGRGIEHFSSVRLSLSRGGLIKRGYRNVGVQIDVEVLRNAYAPPGKVVSLDLLYGKGFRVSASLLDMAEELGVVKRSGSWYSLGGDVLGQGRDAVCSVIERERLWSGLLGRIGTVLRR